MKLIKRPIVEQIKKTLAKNKAVVLIGARQVGKTSILKLLMQEIKRDKQNKPVFYFDLEKEDVLELFVSYKSLTNWLELQGADLKKELYLFVDEFHLAPQPNKLLKVLVDHYPDFHLVVTGSSALKLTEQTKESLAGRKRVFKIWPLDFEEFLGFKESPLLTPFRQLMQKSLKPPQPLANDFLKAWEEFLIFGAYPKVALSQGKEEKVKEIEDIYTAYIQKDIKAFLKLENVLAYNKLIRLSSSQIGSLFNFHNLSKTIGIARETLERYAFVLENTFIIKLLPPFFTNKQKEIVKMSKVFFIDPGMRNFALRDFKQMDLRSDAGSLVENGCLIELIKKTTILDELHFWRTQTKSEVDFILEKQGQPVPIEVKWQEFKSAKVPSPLKTFIKQYHCKQAFVLNKNFIGQVNFNGCLVKFLPVYLTAKVLIY